VLGGNTVLNPSTASAADQVSFVTQFPDPASEVQRPEKDPPLPTSPTPVPYRDRLEDLPAHQFRTASRADSLHSTKAKFPVDTCSWLQSFAMLTGS
jgi:hypothetical protein